MQTFTEQSVSFWSWRTLCLHGWRIYFGFPSSSLAHSKMWEVLVLVQFPLGGCLATSGSVPVHSHLLLNGHSWFYSFTELTSKFSLCAAASHLELWIVWWRFRWAPSPRPLPVLFNYYVPFLASTESHIGVSYNLFMFTYIFKQSSSIFSFT